MQKHVTAIFDKLGLTAGEDDNRRILAVLTTCDRMPTERRAFPAPPDASRLPSRATAWLGPSTGPETRRETHMHSPLEQPLAPPTAVVSARDLVRRYGSGDTAVDALRGVSVDIAEGRLTAVMGPSGSGKSTLMHILAGLDKPTSGEVTVAGVDIAGLDDNALTKLRRDHIGFIFQFFNLLPMLTAAENIALPLKLAGVKPDQAWLDQVVDSVGLTRPAQAPPSELSGGQQQRVAVARALVLAADGDVRRRADRQPRLRTSGEILGAAARRRRHARPDDGDGHPRRARRGDRRPRAVPRRRRHRPRPRPVPRPRDPRDLEAVSGR